ncbi:MAG: hypothetical protein V5A16_03300 [Haloplanus sp.]
MDEHVVGQGLVGVACALFVAGAVGLFFGVVGPDSMVPVGAAGLVCLVAGGALVRRYRPE